MWLRVGTDRKIGAGKEWENEIDKHLNAADIILLLISSDFLASDYCYDVEVQTAMKRHDAGEARVIPIILRPVDWSGAPFSRLQALPKDAKPVTDWPNRDQAFLNVAQGIRAAVEELVASQLTDWFAKLDKAALLGNWPNVINLGERILKLLPDHQPTRSKTAAAYVKRWSHHLGETSDIPDDVTGLINVRTKRHEDLQASSCSDNCRPESGDSPRTEECRIPFHPLLFAPEFGMESVRTQSMSVTRSLRLPISSMLSNSLLLPPSITLLEPA